MEVSFKKQIAIPQDHGSWVFILSPLLVGAFAGQKITLATLYLLIAAMSAFLIRQPLTVLVKAGSGRRPQADLPPARFWILIYGTIAILSMVGLVREGFAFIFYLAGPALLFFAWHLLLVSRRTERNQAGVELLATGVLSLAAPAVFWVGVGGYQPSGWWLWALTWLQSAASIIHAYLRLSQRELNQAPPISDLWSMGRQALLYTSFNLVTAVVLGWTNILPQLIFIPYLVQWMETIWGITHPASGWKPTHIGMRQLIVSTIWTILFIICWRTA